MKIVIGSDHGGFELKSQISLYLEEKGFKISDVGTHSEESSDFPISANRVCEVVRREKIPGILICGTGIGMSIAANKIPEIRAAVVSDSYTAKMTREHNDTNVLCLGARVIGLGVAFEVVDTWLETAFLGGKYQQRLDMIGGI